MIIESLLQNKLLDCQKEIQTKLYEKVKNKLEIKKRVILKKDKTEPATYVHYDVSDEGEHIQERHIEDIDIANFPTKGRLAVNLLNTMQDFNKREKGSHVIFTHIHSGKSFSVPKHDEISPGVHRNLKRFLTTIKDFEQSRKQIQG